MLQLALKLLQNGVPSQSLQEASMAQSFIHLRLHTDASLVDGLVQLKPLMAATTKAGMAAVGITDLNNFFNLVKFQKNAHGAGIKPIYGCDIEVSYPTAKGASLVGGMTLLAQTLDGYRLITRWLSRAYLENQKLSRPVVKWEWFTEAATDGVLVLSGGLDGVLGQAIAESQDTLAQEFVVSLQQAFPDRAYFELHRVGRPGENEYIAKACELAGKFQMPLVATNDVRFLLTTDFDAHEIRCAINSGHTLEDPRRPKNYTPEQYFKTPAQMLELFSDLPEALANTVQIAKRCSVEIPLGTNYLPDFKPPAGLTLDQFFRERSQQGLEERFQKLYAGQMTPEKRQIYQERLDEELDIIIQMGFPGYFLIVMDFIEWAKNNGVPVGPGRGSGAGSLVAYVLSITDIDPIKYDLLFERFLNPERVSMPDFDVDFCMDGRDRVIDYVANRYGRDAVSQIITFGTMAAKAVIRDVGRVLGKPYPFVDRISKMVPFEVGMTLTKAMEQEEAMQALYHNDDEVKEVLDMALQLEGMKRNVGKHAGGVVIAPSQLTDFVPLYCDDQGNNLVTQFDKDDVEQAGLVKFDFLGLRTLTIVDWALKNIKKRYGDHPDHQVDIELLPLNDKKTFDLLQAFETTAVFQLESRGMKDLIKRLQPSSFEDIIALVALFRPGPLQSGMVDDFIDRKHGRAQVVFPHPDLAPVLQNTYGVILYQEQVMQIAQVLANFTLGGADMLRRAMGKKKPEEMDKMRKLFIQGASERQIDPELSGSIFDLMEKFAGYGFNKSHSAAYAMVSYQTAWLKAHYPSEFMAAVLSADMHNTEKVVTLIEECRIMGVKVRPPHVSYSEYAFTVSETGEIIYGLGAIKGLGEGPIEEIVAHKHENYQDLYHFCTTVDARKFNKKSLDALIKSGAMDGLGPNRACLLANMERAMSAATQLRQSEAQGMVDLFSSLEVADAPAIEWIAAEPWAFRQGLKFEKDTLGLYLSGHPLEFYGEELKTMVNMKIKDLRPTEKGKPAKIAGIVVGIRTMRNKKGKKIAFVTIDDRSGRMDISLFSEKYEENAELLQVDKLLMIEGDVSFDDYSGQCKMSAKQLIDIDQMRVQQLKKITLRGNLDELQEQEADWLISLVQEHAGGDVPIELDLKFENQAVTLQMPEQKVTISEHFLETLVKVWGRNRLQLHY